MHSYNSSAEGFEARRCGSGQSVLIDKLMGFDPTAFRQNPKMLLFLLPRPARSDSASMEHRPQEITSTVGTPTHLSIITFHLEKEHFFCNRAFRL
jgi:hypothetical protein